MSQSFQSQIDLYTVSSSIICSSQKHTIITEYILQKHPIKKHMQVTSKSVTHADKDVWLTFSRSIYSLLYIEQRLKQFTEKRITKTHHCACTVLIPYDPRKTNLKNKWLSGTLQSFRKKVKMTYLCLSCVSWNHHKLR